MKKSLLIVLICVLALSSCTTPKETVHTDVQETTAQITKTQQTPEPTPKPIVFDYDALYDHLSRLTFIASNDDAMSLFGIPRRIESDELASFYEIDNALLEDFLLIQHDDTTKAALCMVLKPKKGKHNDVKTQVVDFIEGYKGLFDTYYPDEYALIEQVYTIDKGAYIIYTISQDNAAVIDAINKSKKQ